MVKGANAQQYILRSLIMIKLFLTPICTFLLFSCGQQPREVDKETVKEGNKSTKISKDTAKLSKLINISIYRPTLAQFKYVLIDNSGQNERLSVPGPSSSHLEAVLHFDTITFNKIKTKYLSVDNISSNFDKQEFNFEWLDSKTRVELLKTDISSHGHPDRFFDLGVNGKLWILNNEILITKSTR